jgi:hypothetical protein
MRLEELATELENETPAQKLERNQSIIDYVYGMDYFATETFTVRESKSRHTITRVPGGFVYNRSVFIPLDEF